jgi:putative DNA primase/helicase
MSEFDDLVDEAPEPTTTPFEMAENRATDWANANEIAQRHHNQLLWTPENGWYYYDKTRWAPDANKYRERLVAELVRDMWLRAIDQPDDIKNTTRARAKMLESNKGLNAALKLAEAMMAKSVTELDVHPYLVNCPNGTFDARTHERFDHDPAHYITRIMPTPFDHDAKDEVWDRVLKEAFEGDCDKMNCLQRFIGYSLTSDWTMKTFLAMYGPTNAGKSTIIEPISGTMGDVDEGGYATTWDAEVIQADSNINKGEKLNKARAARFIVVGELEKGKKMADGFVKRFVGGTSVDAKALYKGSYSYKPQGKLLLDTNYVPRSADPAVHGRLLLLPVLHVPPVKDGEIKRHLDESLDAHKAILAWAMEGCRQWWLEKSFGPTPWLDAAKAKYIRSSDPLVNLHDDCFDDTSDEAEAVPAVLGWQVYQAWCTANGSKPMTKGSFADAMEERGYTKTKMKSRGGAWFFMGVKLKPMDEFPEDVRFAVFGSSLSGQNGTS